MPYVGGKLASMYRPEPTELALRDMADRGGDRVHTLVVENTPIGGRYEVGGFGGGNLRTSWYRLPVDRRRRGGFTIYVATVATDVDYAPHVEWGTGLWGPEHRKYLIEPKNPKGYLRWRDPKTGEDVFAKRVWHPGSPGQHMMAIAVAATEMEIDQGLFDDILMRWKRDQEALAD